MRRFEPMQSSPPDQKSRRVALFDLDGVLLDTEPLYTEATQAIVGRFGKTYDWALKRHTMGRDARVSAALILERLGIPMEVEAFLDERQPILEALLAESPAMAGAEEFVAKLVERNVPIAVATSSERALFDLKVKGHSWFTAFHAVVCGDDPRVRAKKPAPDIFLAAASDVGATPASCIVFEDSLAGLEAALAANMRVVALPDPALDPATFVGAHRVVSGFHEVDWSDLVL
jgi:pseudouridine-5'-monophosphatase